MAGETIRTEAICLDICPWSQTSHVVTWLTPNGKVSTVVKGAVRPKSQFLGQYDLNYTCDLLYYARAKGDLHPLRECVPADMRDSLRTDHRSLVLAGYFRRLALDLAPVGPECGPWYDLLSRSLSFLAAHPSSPASLPAQPLPHVSCLLRYELDVLGLSGLTPDFSGYDRNAEWSAFSIENGSFSSASGRIVRVSRETAAYLCDPTGPCKKMQTPLDAARVIGVFYHFHVDCASEVRRTVLGLIS